MKKKYPVLIGALALGVAIVWWTLGNRPMVKSQPAEVPEVHQQAETSLPTNAMSSNQATAQRPTNQQGFPMSDVELEAYGRKAIAEQAARNVEIEKQWKAQWDTPINFYGKVVDENGVSVADATIDFARVDITGEAQHDSAVSDVQGLFSLEGVKGRSLSVQVSKQGYYNSRRNQTSFLYSDVSGRGTFTPEPTKPVFFHLRKKGRGVDLITSDRGFQPNVSARIPRGNATVWIDFLEKQPGLRGQLEISQNKPPWHDATNWSFRLSIPDGGLVENQDEFQFEAPESGYAPSLEFKYSKTETNWTTQATKQFYIAFGQPRQYGWLRIESNLAQETVFLTYAINPDGSRYLEPK